MSQFIDRRLNGKNKSAVNRQRFIRRFRGQIKKAVSEAITQRGITDTRNGEAVNIPARDISEPHFHHGEGGVRDIIHPGNKEFNAGDRVKRQQQGQGKGSGKGKASNEGEGEDDFVFQLSNEEFLEFFFEDLELPNMVKTQLAQIEAFKTQRAGHQSDGVPTNINIVRSLRGAQARRIAIGGPYRAEIKDIDAKLAELHECGHEDSEEARLLRERREELEAKIKKIPWIDTFDLRFNNFIKVPKPTTQAVMFCIMDVSGSMGQHEKDVAKRFFILLYLFLSRVYEKIDVVFIRHHTVAKEVDEEEFFYSRESGGTVVSSALELMKNVAHDRYPPGDWNLYAAQASDGDNWNNDSRVCRDLLINDIMPLMQYFAYIEITADAHQSLWDEYQAVCGHFENFATQQIKSHADIYPVFRELFKKQNA